MPLFFSPSPSDAFLAPYLIALSILNAKPCISPRPSAIRLVPNCEGALVISRYVGPPVIVQGVREKNPSGGDIARPMSGIVGELVKCVRCACPACGPHVGPREGLAQDPPELARIF